ncbi:MAG: competence/damage-inducible protein A [Christensenellales bacterium]|jgi:nicotinamide-nucleotide amidase
MIAEILGVGTELLMGQIANTDAQYLSKQMANLGINVYYHSVVGDNPARMRETFQRAWDRSDLVIATGGLGPTQDDITKEIIAQCLGREMVLDEPSKAQLEAYFKDGRVMTPNNLRQAYFPEGGRILPNRRGTAPGCILEQEGKAVVILPGPPFELTDMFEQQVLPYLQARSGERIASKFLRIYGAGESQVSYELRDLIDSQTNPTLATYVGFGEVMLRITAKVKLGEDPEPLIAPIEAIVRERFGEKIYGTGDAPLHEVVARMLMDQGKTLSLAESCTGGMIAQQLVEIPGVSSVLMEGVVCYSNQAKVRRLGVRESTLAAHGAVSEQTAREMAQGSRRVAGTDYALAVTGIAGPDGGTAEKPVGLVYVALDSARGCEVVRLHLNGDRQRIRMRTALSALDLLRKELLR